MNQYKGGKGADRQGWLSFWNGAAVLVNRKTRKEAIVLDNPFVGVAGCLPPDMLELLSDEQGREDGFVHRLLCAFPDPLALRWTEAVVSDATLEAYGRVFEGLWALPGAADQRPHVISFTPAGRQIFIEVANALYAELADPDFPDALRGPFAKLEGYGARLALILQCCRLVCGEATSEAVDEVSGLAAAALVHYFQSHARRVYARLQATPEEQHVAKALDWLRRHQGTATVREFVTAKVAGVRDAPGAEALFSALEARGYARVEETHPSRGGRPTTRVHLLR